MSWRKRFAAAAALAALGGGGVALGAFAGNTLVLVSSDGATTATVCGDVAGTTTVSAEELQAQVAAAPPCSDATTSTEPPPTTSESQPTEPPPSPTPTSPPPPPAENSGGQSNGGAPSPGSSADGGNDSGGNDSGGNHASTTKAHHPPDREAPTPSTHAVLWLHAALGDPTPRAKRLSPDFAKLLRATAHRHELAWWRVLGYARARGHRGRFPVHARQLDRIAVDLVRAGARKHPWAAFYLLSRKETPAQRTRFARRALALAQYDRAVTLHGLVVGLRKEKGALAKRVLGDRDIELYAGGRADIEAGRVNVRILVLLRYLRIAYGTVTVSCLVSGHSFFARPGVVSAHVFGLAADIAALGGVPILGHQAPGGLTAHAIRKILLLPRELRPQQVISLLGLGGPSFPLADHYDHIHVGY